MEVRREIEARTGRDASIGAVYATLDRLGTKGLVRSQELAPEGEKGRPRTGAHAGCDGQHVGRGKGSRTMNTVADVIAEDYSYW